MTSNKFLALVARMSLVLSVIFGFAMLTACSDPPKEWPPITIQGEMGQGSSAAGHAEHFVRHYTATIGEMIAIGFFLIFLLVIPWAAIFGTLESLLGKAEVPIEAGIVLLASIGLWHYSDTFSELGLGWDLLFLDVIPALLALIFQEKKKLLFAIPAGGALLLLVVRGYAWIVDAFTEHSIVMVGGVVIGGVLLLIWAARRK
jgi:hypothetical protein